MFKLVRQPVNAQAGLYYNVVRPEDYAHWQVRWQIALLYPKRKLAKASRSMGGYFGVLK